MATVVAGNTLSDDSAMMQSLNGIHDDPFVEGGSTPGQTPYVQRFSSRFDLESSTLGVISSPTQVKRVLEAHLHETERRLEDTKTLGESLLAQQSKLQDKLREVEEQQDEEEITPVLKQQLQDIGREHDDVSREIARSLLAPKLMTTGSEDKIAESAVYTSQASGSPTKISAPNRRQRNQPTSRTADVQFAADISVSLLGQVRALQAAVAERDETINHANTDRLRLESDITALSQRIRTHDENEQRYKDENWNLETQNHELFTTTKDLGEREKKLNASLAAALVEKARLLNEIEESKLAHGKLFDEHSTSRKAHETELHSLKRDFNAADSERTALQNKIDELTSQNQELARAVTGKYRNITPNETGNLHNGSDDFDDAVGTPEHSPPPSPTKATPRHGGLESETLRSSLHHAHRQIQNLKGNIHREKTERIELKRMLQEARDELEQQRAGIGSATKKQKSRNEVFKKPTRPDMLGGNRRSHTDIEVEDDNWEDQTIDSPQGLSRPAFADRGFANTTDMSDAYQTAHETENDFETADERHTTESEAFETGAESLAGDSTDELTETEDNASRAGDRGVRASRSPFGARRASRNSFYSTASTSAGEEDEQLQTPVQSVPHKFRLRNGRYSYARQAHAQYGDTPDSARTTVVVPESPSTVTEGRSPPSAEQSLFAELGGLDDANSDRFSTPARSSIFTGNTPGSTYTPSRAAISEELIKKPPMTDTGMMTEAWEPTPSPAQLPAVAVSSASGILVANSIAPLVDRHESSSTNLVAPPSVSGSPLHQTDTGTQYTPQKSLESPRRHTAFITPPRTEWDEVHTRESSTSDLAEQETAESPTTQMTFSGVLSQETVPTPSPQAAMRPRPNLTYSSILAQHTQPVAPKIAAPLPPVLISRGSEASTQTDRPKTAEKVAAGAVGGGLLATAAAALGLGSKNSTKAADVEGENSGNFASPPEQIFKSAPEATAHTLSQPGVPINSDSSVHGISIPYSSNDQGAQTTLTAGQIEEALRVQPRTPTALVPPVTFASSKPAVDAVRAASPLSFMTQGALVITAARPSSVGPSSPSRPSSASSQRPSSTTIQSHPPLPSDYRTNIARANSLATSQDPKRDTTITATTGIMGPPLVPASAMRRPKTPGESVRSPTREGTASRASQSSRYQRGVVESRVSRRSSVSSFASELDERFNIRPDGHGPGGRHEGPPTDPRMIQAITQTMIGEYLWKYTRKAGSKEMSSTRHRRYFWVHPYNKTLHWSSFDPQAAGEKENKSKGVIIESVRVVSDDNPMPPGLHRKSLEISTPGRKIKVTASTGQRHETWFNALSYLLLCADPLEQSGPYNAGATEITTDDLNEFNAGGYTARLVPNSSRISMSSYNSRTTQANSTHRNSRQPLPSNVTSTPTVIHEDPIPSTVLTASAPVDASEERATRADQSLTVDRDRTIRARSISRISRIFGSVTQRSSQQPVGQPETTQRSRGHRRMESENSIYDASVVSDGGRDSAEEMRQEMLRQEAAGLGASGLENVRACCDGKHDVSTLRGEHRHSSQRGPLQSVTDKINRSVGHRV